MEREVRYARSGEVHIAYEIVGEGSRNLVFVPGFLAHLEYQWEEPSQATFFRRLASFRRLIRFNKRGTGLSDRDVAIPTLEDRVDDLGAVMDGALARSAALMGLSEGGPLSLAFAAMYLTRVSRGSHHYFESGHRKVTVPNHGRELGKGLLLAIIKQSGIPREK